jgi:hypothetical protein
MMRTGNAKAKFSTEIKCGIQGSRVRLRRQKCPRNPSGRKFRGIHKCWGCPSAYWADSGKPYGPWRRMM